MLLNLKQTQNIEKDILKEFIVFCEKNNLRYSLIGGTLLGAIRHQGFIPWDDDIDVAMPRVDYDIFLKKFFSNKYHLLNNKNSRWYPFPFTKMIASYTKGGNSDLRKIKDYGVYIDIFPVDNILKNNKELDMLISHNIKIAYSRICNYSKKNWWKYKNNNKKLEFILWPINLIFGIYWRYLKNYKKEITKLEKKYVNKNETNEVKFFFDEKWPFVNIDDFNNFEIKKFEDLKCRVIKSWDYWLKKFYGDYTIIPNENERIQHPHEFYLKEKVTS